mmetsp:Transcript_11360/g.28238  ORF Transcript_11360/g.28238 Transcript_11360/m.28238 type:complete len:510 (-) Transcript_11360:391-1920(-)
MLCAGPIYTFGAIHSSIKTLLSATELQVQLIGVAGDVGLWTKVFPGLAFDLLGARATMLGGAVLSGLGYVLMYFALLEQWPPVLVAGAWFLAGEGSGFILTSALFASTKNFAPKDRGIVTGILACMFGTSATVLGSLLGGCLGGHIDNDGECQEGFLGGSVTNYMVLLAVAIPAITIIAALATRVREGHVTGERDHASFRFTVLLVSLSTLIAVVFGKNLVEKLVEPSIKTWANYVLLALLSLFLCLSVGAGPAGASPSKDTIADSETDSGQESTAAPSHSDDDKAGRPAECQALFWSHFLAFGITIGVDLMTLNILSAIVASRGMDHRTAGSLVVIQMGFDTTGRLASGFLVGKLKLTQLLVLAPALTVVGQILLAAGSSVGLYIACAMLGLSDGIMWTMGPLFIGKAFGLQRVGRHFGVTVLSAAIFQAALSLGLEPFVYRQHTLAGETVCFGNSCFAATHWTACAAACVAIAAALHVHFGWSGEAATGQKEADSGNDDLSDSSESS